MKKVAILQSNYIPWKGYFDVINSVSEFILLDDVQYTKRDWRNRNLIKTQKGLEWLSIPVSVKGKFLQKINETKIMPDKWQIKHWEAIKTNYGRAPFFKDYKDVFEEIYLKKEFSLLSDVNLEFIRIINEILGIDTIIRSSSEFSLTDDKTERLLSICEQVSADVYLSGPAAKDYLKVDLFFAKGIQVHWMSYDNYPEYQQRYGDFVHGVTVLDLIFNTGPNARDYMLSFKNENTI